MFPNPLRIFLVLSIALPAYGLADSRGETFIDPAQAGADFAVQGEYTGENCAAQVIALGDGKFHVLGWSKGLPGTVENPEKKVEVDAQQNDGKIVFDGNGWKGTIENGVLAGTSSEGVTWTLKHIVRESPTLGAKPPVDAVVLFDGSNVDAWQDGKIDERRLLQGGTKSKRSFGDFTLHLEFRTPFMPAARGQARGNSGVYLQDRYECQILDSFGLKGENNEAGAIYKISKPILNMCLPPLSWQTYDIEFESARFDGEGKKTKNAVITAKLNGVLVQDHVEAPQTTRSAGTEESADPAPLQLQNHGNPVFFRNIWVLEKK